MICSGSQGKTLDPRYREIDNLVYDLYGLTRAERKLVEEGVEWK